MFECIDSACNTVQHIEPGLVYVGYVNNIDDECRLYVVDPDYLQ